MFKAHCRMTRYDCEEATTRYRASRGMSATAEFLFAYTINGGRIACTIIMRFLFVDAVCVVQL